MPQPGAALNTPHRAKPAGHSGTETLGLCTWGPSSRQTPGDPRGRKGAGGWRRGSGQAFCLRSTVWGLESGAKGVMPLTSGDNGPYAATCASRQLEKTAVPSLLVTGQPPALALLMLHSCFRYPRLPGPPFAPEPWPRAPRLPAGAGRPPATAARSAQPGSVAQRAGCSHEVTGTRTGGSVRILPAHPVLALTAGVGLTGDAQRFL